MPVKFGPKNSQMFGKLQGGGFFDSHCNCNWPTVLIFSQLQVFILHCILLFCLLYSLHTLTFTVKSIELAYQFMCVGCYALCSRRMNNVRTIAGGH